MQGSLECDINKDCNSCTVKSLINKQALVSTSFQVVFLKNTKMILYSSWLKMFVKLKSS